MENMNGPDRSLPLSKVVRIEQVCDRFGHAIHDAIQNGASWPSIEDYLRDTTEPIRSQLQKMLSAVEASYRQQQAKVGDPANLATPAEISRGQVRDSGGAPARGPSAAEQTAAYDPLDRPSAIVADPALGTKVRYFGDYELIKVLGSGGMGVVFQAKQLSLGRLVAIKVMHRGTLASEADVQRFHIEAATAAAMNHPNIVPIYEVGEHEGQQFLSMGFVPGKSLQNRLIESPIPPREAAEIVRQTAIALQHAHERGFIHRDLKPHNVLLEADGTPKLTDFGLAKRIGDGGLTQTGQVLGTPSYMSPEQAAGSKDVGPAADIYGLGATLFAMLTGQPPFQAATPLQTLQAVLEVEPTPPRHLDSSIPKQLETIVLKCLEKQPANRYATMADLAGDLRRFLDGETIAAQQTTILRRWRAKASKQPLSALGAICGVLLTITIFVCCVIAGFKAVLGFSVFVLLILVANRIRARLLKTSGQVVNLGATAFVSWRIREERQVVVSLLGIPFFFGALAFFLMNPKFIGSFVSYLVLLVSLGYAVFFLFFSWGNWRCPCCGRHLFSYSSPRSCPKCRARLKP